MLNLGPETEYVEHKKSTGEIKEGMQSIGSISTAEVVKMNDMSRRGAQMLLNRLIEKGIVEKTGVGRSTRYRLTE